MTRIITERNRYVDRTPGSRKLFERAKEIEPAGVSYRNRYFEPYPFSVSRASGARLIDVDGNEYVDYWCTHFAMILSHANPQVQEAISKQLDNGWHYGLAHELEVTHAEKLAEHVPSAEMVRYTSSGSEADFFAVRLARTFTGRKKIAKFEGCWHGAYDALHIAVKPPFDVPPSGGLTSGSQEDTIVVPYNDLDGFLVKVNGEKLACVILEPVMGAGGMIPAKPDFLKALREYCDRTGALLIFDEVITGFRLGLTGAQGYYNVTPDVTVLGKIIGGGLPIGAVCGKSEIMEHMDHTKYSGLDYAFHGGTFSGNVLSLTAGLATIHVLEHTPVYEHIDKLGSTARKSLSRVFTENAYPAHVTGIGSLFAIHFSPGTSAAAATIHSSRDAGKSKSLFNHLLENGILIITPESMHGGVCYCHTENDIENLRSVVEDYVKMQ